MTAIRDRQSDADADKVALRWDERPVVGDRRGLPWWGAVLLAFGLAVIGATIDMESQNALGWLFNVCYFLGTVGAVCAVQRRSMFAPMVQPPLILAITVPLVVLLITGLPANSDTLAKALAVGTPLINGFPTMAVTTGLTLIIGIVRLYRERDPDAPAKGAKGRPADNRRQPNQARGRDAAAARAGDRAGREGARRDGRALRDGPPGRGRGPADGRSQATRAAMGNEHPSLPPARRPRPADEPPLRGGPRGRDGDPGRRGGDRAGRGEPTRGMGGAGRAARGGAGGRGEPPGRGGDAVGRGGEPPRGGKTPPGRRIRPPRGGDDLDPRRGESRSGGAPDADRPRRTPPASGDPRGGAPGDPRRAPRRREGPPPRGRRPWEDEA